MRIGIDCRTILNPASGERAGVGHYTYHLVKALLALDTANQYVLFFDHRMALEGTQEFQQPNVRIRFFPFSTYGKFLPIAYSQLLTAAVLQREKLDLFHAPANIVPLGYRGRSIVTVHDLAIFRHPEWFPTQLLSTRVLVPQTLHRAQRIIAVSKTTQHDLQELFQVPEHHIDVIPEAAEVTPLPLHDAGDDIRTLYQLPEKFILYVGTIEPRKNIPNLLKAWREVRETIGAQLANVELILAGGLGYRGKEQLSMLAETPQARYIGYVSHNHKIKLLDEASALVFPSWYEGFGLPVLEAMTLGTPVITSNSSSLPEVAGTAAVLIDPKDNHALAKAILDVVGNPAEAASLAERGRQQAAKYSWASAARATAAAYHHAVE